MSSVMNGDIPDIPEGVDRCLGVPALDDVRLMQTQQRFHRLLCHIGHRLLMHERNEAIDQLQGTALYLVTCLAWILQ